MTTQLRAARDVARTPSDPGPPLTVLGVLADGWTWRTDPDDQQDRGVRARASASAGAGGDDRLDRHLIRAFLWAQILIS